MTSQVTTRQRGTSSSQWTVLSLLLYAHVKIEVSFETAWHPSAQNTMHVSPMEAPPQLEFTPTPLCVRVSEQSLCEHDGQTVCASLTNSPDERQRKEVVETLPSASYSYWASGHTTALIQDVTALVADTRRRVIKRTNDRQALRYRPTSRTTSPATSLYTHVKVPLVSFAAWHPSAQLTAQLSPMVQEGQSGPDQEEQLGKRPPMEHVSASQVGYGSVGSPTKAPSEPQVNTVEDAVPEIAALPY